MCLMPSIVAGWPNGLRLMSRLSANEEYGYCSLIKAAKSVPDRLNVENRTLAKFTSKERIERKLVNPIALREAVINTIVHNDYSLEVLPSSKFTRIVWG